MSGAKFRAVKAVLFDMDGLLLDTENIYTLGTQSILNQYDKVYSWDFKAKLMGKRTDEVARYSVAILFKLKDCITFGFVQTPKWDFISVFLCDVFEVKYRYYHVAYCHEIENPILSLGKLVVYFEF